MRLTEVKRKALEWFRDNDGAKLFPIGIPKRTICALIADGLLREERPQFGFVEFFITESGCLALLPAGEGGS